MIPKLIDYISSELEFFSMPYDSWYKNINRFNTLFINNKLNTEKVFNILTKCNCCQFHKNKNSSLIFLKNGYENEDFFGTSCQCECTKYSLTCMTCSDYENYDLDLNF